jgi:8-oxo-dGTP pyrophosphatase MutT (NUDIX family)
MAPRRELIEETPHGIPADPSPSASIILVSPSNQILLLHRVQTSSSFPSAHVFPGGNLSTSDGTLPSSPTDPRRHQDSLAYRTGAIRELFEESGILLARKNEASTGLLEVSARDRLTGRKAVHGGKVQFKTWLADQSKNQGVLDTEALIPFTHWLTPPNLLKRYTTQMYVYFVPLEERGNVSMDATSDEVETMAAEWGSARSWLERSRRGDIILFPPQFLLLFLISEHLDRGRDEEALSDVEILTRREALRRFIEMDSEPPWKDKFISPIGFKFGLPDGRSVLGLEKPGPELKHTELKGEADRVVVVKFGKEGPRKVEVRWRKDVLEQQRKMEEAKL